jgi:hypothetical protein
MFCEDIFIKNFILLYEEADEYNIDIPYDEYFNYYITSNTNDENKEFLEYYYTQKEIEDFIKIISNDYKIIASIVLYKKLYDIIEKEIIDKYDSEAETDIDVI